MFYRIFPVPPSSQYFSIVPAFCRRPMCSVSVPVFRQNSVIVTVLCHRPSALPSFHGCVIVPGLCYRTGDPLSSHYFAIVSLLCHCTNDPSSSQCCCVIVPVLCHRPNDPSSFCSFVGVLGLMFRKHRCFLSSYRCFS